MIFKPRPYQQHAINHILENPFCGLFLDMGLGKTVSALTAVNEMMFETFEARKVLIIAPLKVAQSVWSAEIEKWRHLKHLRLSKVLGSEKQRKEALKAKAELYVINRENVVWLVALLGQKWPFDTVIIDELSSFKSAKAARFRALKKVRPFMRRVIGLTGTPAPNSLLDLWPQLYLIDQGQRLGQFITNFRDRHFNHSPYKHSYELKKGHNEIITGAIKDICISMKAKDHLKELPERIDITRSIEFSPAVQRKYDDFVKTELLKLPDLKIIDPANAAVLTGKLLQFTAGAVYDENRTVHELHTEKIETLIEAIEQANGNPVLIFYIYQHSLTRIMHALKAYKPVKLDKPEIINSWNAKKIQVMLAQPQGAGHGLNLQYGGSIIEWFDLTFSNETYLQAVGRIDRQGQTETVRNSRLVVKNSMDEHALAVVSGKIAQQDAVMLAVKALIKNYL